MSRIILFMIVFLLSTEFSYGQGQYNNFEKSFNLSILIDTTFKENSWQIGKPSKVIFSSASSKPNALVTDTLNPYPMNDHSSFMLKMHMTDLWNSELFLILSWHHKMDSEPGVDGGLIEVSYDTMNTWVNIFEDDVFEPMFIDLATDDTLFTGEPGVSFTNTKWESVGICWANHMGYPVDDVYVRFTFLSDSVDTHQEGWLMDNFEVGFLIVDDIEEEAKPDSKTSAVTISPNPATNQLVILSILPIDRVKVIDQFGREFPVAHHNGVIEIHNLVAGQYFLIAESGKSRHVSRFTKI